MKKNDKILIIMILIASVLLGGWYLAFREEGHYVVVEMNSEEYGVYPLDQDQVVQIGDTNILEIRDGQAFMIHADCPDQLCVNMKPISESFELIVCLPNKVTVEVREK